MKFTLHISVKNPKKGIREELLNLIGNHLQRRGYQFNAGFAVNDYELEINDFKEAWA